MPRKISKSNFAKLQAYLGKSVVETEKRPVGRPRKHDKKTGLPEDERRYTFIAKKWQIEKMNELADKAGISLKELFADAMTMILLLEDAYLISKQPK
jgi:hypothetical protein